MNRFRIYKWDQNNPPILSRAHLLWCFVPLLKYSHRFSFPFINTYILILKYFQHKTLKASYAKPGEPMRLQKLWERISGGFNVVVIREQQKPWKVLMRKESTWLKAAPPFFSPEPHRGADAFWSGQSVWWEECAGTEELRVRGVKAFSAFYLIY